MEVCCLLLSIFQLVHIHVNPTLWSFMLQVAENLLVVMYLKAGLMCFNLIHIHQHEEDML